MEKTKDPFLFFIKKRIPVRTASCSGSRLSVCGNKLSERTVASLCSGNRRGQRVSAGCRPRPAALAGVDGPRACSAQPPGSRRGRAQTAVRRSHTGCDISLNVRPNSELTHASTCTRARVHTRARTHAHTHVHADSHRCGIWGGVVQATKPKGPAAAWHAFWNGGVTALGPVEHVCPQAETGGCGRHSRTP